MDVCVAVGDGVAVGFDVGVGGCVGVGVEVGLGGGVDVGGDVGVRVGGAGSGNGFTSTHSATKIVSTATASPRASQDPRLRRTDYPSTPSRWRV